MISDIHLHTEFSGDSNTPVRAQIEQAIRLGMEEICITDHHDYDVISEIDFTLDIPRYVEEITRVEEEYKDKIRVNLGIELGLQCHLKEYLEQLAGRYPFDFIIGSSHFVNRIDPYYPAFYEGKSEDEAYRGYFEATLKRLSLLDCYDSVGHVDYVVRYGPNETVFIPMRNSRTCWMRFKDYYPEGQGAGVQHRRLQVPPGRAQSVGGDP